VVGRREKPWISRPATTDTRRISPHPPTYTCVGRAARARERPRKSDRSRRRIETELPPSDRFDVAFGYGARMAALKPPVWSGTEWSRRERASAVGRMPNGPTATGPRRALNILPVFAPIDPSSIHPATFHARYMREPQCAWTSVDHRSSHSVPSRS
jgi:hypothetical protein